MRKSNLNIRFYSTAAVLLSAVVVTGCGICRTHERAERVYHSERVVATVGDQDGDGVPDDRDNCPNTPRGFEVDSHGCIINQNVILRTVNFVYNSDRLTGPAEDTLDQVAAGLIGQPTLSVQIGGHTDSVGSAGFNQRLSERRAQSVRHYLIGKGVKAKNLQARGFGKSKPIASNETAEGRTENRRVEFAVVDKPEHVNVLRGESTESSKDAAKQAAARHNKRKHRTQR